MIINMAHRSRIIVLLTTLVLALASIPAQAARFNRVVLDPGHGGKDKGAYWGGIRESELNLKVAKKAANLLRAHGLSVTMTRESDKFIALSRRASLANRYGDALFVSIHFNASTHTYVRGVETFYASKKGKKLAGYIQSSMVEKLHLKNRRIRLGKQYAMLNRTRGTAVLVECGYISNAHERNICRRSWFQSLAASAIVDGILRYRQ